METFSFVRRGSANDLSCLANHGAWLGLPSIRVLPLSSQSGPETPRRFPSWYRRRNSNPYSTRDNQRADFLHGSIPSERESLVHLGNEVVDEVLAVAEVTALDEVTELAGAEATGGRGQLEGPQEVGGLLEVGADGVDLVDEVLNTDDAELAEVLLDQLVVGDGQALLVDLSVTALVDELTDGLQVGVAVGDEGLDDLQHLGGGLGQADEDTVVDLEKTEELEGLALLGVNLVDTLDADDEGKLGLGRDVERTLLLGDTLQADLLALCIAVLLDVGLSALEDLLTLGLGLLF